ncbi:MAG TPA: gluconokinase [Pseudonocardiaceae bacterium]|jgi:gluconokinase|nr:gluconokinase [Pseudonocardiaceae bacterium]
MTRSVVLGVDLGTTATKVVASTVDGRRVAFAERGYPLRTDSTGAATQDPDVVAAQAIAAITECARGLDVAAICFSAAMHTLLALDADGRPLTQALSWADNRAADTARALRADPARASALHRATGTPVHPMSPLVKLAWFAEHEPDPQRATAHWVGLKDYVLYRLTGHLVTDHSCASGTGLLDIHRLAWHPESLRLAGITAAQLPDLLPPNEIRPLRAEIDGLPTGLPVVVGGADGPLANLGTGAVRPGTAAVSLGTSGALRVITETPGVDEAGRVFCYALADGLWVRGGAISNGGVVAAWAADTFGVDVATLLTEAAATSADDLLALPYLLGERAPWWEPDPRAVILGLRREHGRAELTRALLDGVGQQLALVAEAVPGIGEIRATGGAFRAPIWGQVIAAALNRPLALTAEAAGSGLGAALLGWHALGALPTLAEVADLITPTHIISPDPDLARSLARRRPLVERAHTALREIVTDLAT